MASTTAMYKGVKADLVRFLRERDQTEEAIRSLDKWCDKKIVEALVQSDIALAGTTAAGVNSV